MNGSVWPPSSEDSVGLEDSGEVRKSPTGAHRDSNAGKGRYDLISPIAIARLARINELGGLKRGDRNWERGMPMSWFVDSALRHLFEYLEGMSNEDHLAQAFWNIMCAMHTEECIVRRLLPAELMDLPNYQESSSTLLDEIQAGFDEQENTNPSKETEQMSFTVATPLRFYVGGPYSDPDPRIRALNTQAALEVSIEIARRGHFVHCPHAATGYMDGIMPYEYFMIMDFSVIIAWSNAHFHIADSPGADRELCIAREKKNMIFTRIDQVPFVEPNKYVPLDEQPELPTEQPAKGSGDGNSDLEQANPAERSNQAVPDSNRIPSEASCKAAEESR